MITNKPEISASSQRKVATIHFISSPRAGRNSQVSGDQRSNGAGSSRQRGFVRCILRAALVMDLGKAGGVVLVPDDEGCKADEEAVET
jgi:hypothetical protein